MVIIKVNNLDELAGLAPAVQKRLAKARAIEEIPYHKRTPGQQAFLTSIQEYAEKPSQPKIFHRSIPANLTPVERSVLVNQDGALLNEFSTELYPVNEPLRGKGFNSKVALPEVVLPPELNEVGSVIATRPGYLGMKQYPNTAVVKPTISGITVDSSGRVIVPRGTFIGSNVLPTRFSSPEDLITEAQIEKNREALVSIPSASLSSKGVTSTLAELYQDIINRTPSSAFIPGSGENISVGTVTDVPRYLIKAGREPEDRYNSGLIVRSDDKGRSFKRNALLNPEDAELLNVADEVAKDYQNQSELITTLGPEVISPKDSSGLRRAKLQAWIEGVISNDPTRSQSFITTTPTKQVGITNRANTIFDKEQQEFVEDPKADLSPYEWKFIPSTDLEVSNDGTLVRKPGVRLRFFRPPIFKKGGDKTMIQASGWAGLQSGSGLLQNAFARAEALDIPYTQALAQLQSGAAYQASRANAGIARSRAEAELLAYNDAIARQNIQQDREAAKQSIAYTGPSFVSTPQSSSITPQERLAIGLPVLEKYNQQIARPGLENNVEIPGLLMASSDFPRRLVPYTLRTTKKDGLPGDFKAGARGETLAIQVPYGTRALLRTPRSPLTYEKPPLAIAGTKRLSPVTQDEYGNEVSSLLSGGFEQAPQEKVLVPRTAVQSFDPLNPEEEIYLANTEFGRRNFIGGDPVDFDFKVSERQKVVRAEIQRIADQVVPLTMSRQMEPFTAGQLALAQIDEQIQRIQPLYQNALARRGGDPSTYERTLQNLSTQKQQLKSLFDEHDTLDQYRQSHAKALQSAFELMESPEQAATFRGVTPSGIEFEQPLADRIAYIQRQTTTKRFGIPDPVTQPQLITKNPAYATRSDKKAGLYTYGGPDNYSIISDPAEDPRVFKALVAQNPEIQPGQVRKGVQWAELPDPSGKGTYIQVYSTGKLATDPRTGKPLYADPQYLVGYDSQLGTYSEQKLPPGYNSNRSNRAELLQAANEGYTPPRLSADILLKDVRAQGLRSNPPLVNRQIGGETYRVVDSTGKPLVRQYSQTPQSKVEPQLTPAMTGDRGQILTPNTQFSSELQLEMNLSSPQRNQRQRYPEDFITNLSQVDSLSGSDPEQRKTLFELADSLGVTGTSLIDSRGNFSQLKNEIKSKLISRSPEKFATNSQFFRTKLPSGLAEPEEVRQALNTQFNFQTESLSYKPLSENDARRIVARMRQDPALAQNTSRYLTQVQESLSKEIQAVQSQRQFFANQFEKLRSVPDMQSQIQAEKALSQLKTLDPELDNLQSRSNTLKSNLNTIRQMYGY